MKNKNIAVSIIFLSLISANACALTKNFTFEVVSGGETTKETMMVKHETYSTQVTRTEQSNERQVIKLKGKTKITGVTYFDKDGKEKISVKYDYKNALVCVDGVKKKNFKLTERTFDARALFYMLGCVYPKNGGEFDITLLQSWGPRAIDMYFKDMGVETIEIMGSAVKARKYEMGLLGAIESTIWPHKYYYWYDAVDRRILKFTGRNEDGKIETIELTGYSEEI